MGAMYAVVLFFGGTNTSAVQSIVAIERTVFYRERAARMYSPSVFFGTLFKNLAKLFCPLLMCTSIQYFYASLKYNGPILILSTTALQKPLNCCSH